MIATAVTSRYTTTITTCYTPAHTTSIRRAFHVYLKSGRVEGVGVIYHQG